MKLQIVIDTAQTAISVKDQCFYIRNKNIQRKVSPKRVSSIAITSNAIINASAIILAAENQVPIYYFDTLGEVKAKLYSPYFSNLASLRRKQLLWTFKKEGNAFFIDSLLLKFELQLTLLGQLQRQKKVLDNKKYEFEKYLNSKIEKVRSFKEQPASSVRNQLMGLEGAIAKKYWQCLSFYLPTTFQFAQRSRRPAKDMFNAGLNYLYGMTYSAVEAAVFAAGLDPLTDCIHAENYYKTSLVFDVIEPFRPLVDKLLVELCIDAKINTTHFSQKGNGYLVNKQGKKILIPAFNEYQNKKMVFNEKLSTFKNHIYHFCQNMAQEIKTMPYDILDHV